VFDPVVIIGGGPTALEVCSSLSTHFPDLSLVLILPGQCVLPSIFATNQSDKSGGGGGGGDEAPLAEGVEGGEGKGPGPCEELAAFYESQLVKRGIKIARGFSVARLWLPHEEVGGSERGSHLSNMCCWNASNVLFVFNISMHHFIQISKHLNI
jgi:hypothetical protein